jgi:integrase
MGTVFRKQVTRPLPAGAEVFVRHGERYARWKDRKGKTRTAPVTTGKDGTDRIVTESPYFVAKYRDGSGVVCVEPTGCRDETAARQVLAELERRAELVRSNVMTAAEVAIGTHQASPLAKHFDAFDEHYQAKGVTRIHREDTGRYVRRLAADCAFRTLADLRREALERWLALRAAEGMSARARNAYRNALSSFCNWCVETRRLALNPFDLVPKANEKADPRRQRRAMTEAELVKLLDVARERPLLEALTVRKGPRKGERYAEVRLEVRERLELLGRERALIYKTMVLSGLRRGELASLTLAHVHLDDPVPFVSLDAADEKNREGNAIALRDDLAADLRAWLADKLRRLQKRALQSGAPIPARLPPDTPLFKVPSQLVKILDRDLVAAGIARRVKVSGKWIIDKRDDRGRSLDVHALRTTFGTWLSKGGVAPRTAQAAMRHSDIKLTMGVYTDPKLLDVRGALDALPALSLHAQQAAEESVQATGTDGAARMVAPTVAPTADNRGQLKSNPVLPASDGGMGTIVTSGSSDKRKGRLSSTDNRPSCRGDWIRTSDLLNPIFPVKSASSHRMSQMQAFWRLIDFTLRTVYPDSSSKSTICPQFPGFSVPKRAQPVLWVEPLLHIAGQLLRLPAAESPARAAGGAAARRAQAQRGAVEAISMEIIDQMAAPAA